MGGALIKAAAKSVSPENILVYDLCSEKAEEFEKTLSVSAVSEDKVIAEAKYIFLAVKPQVLPAAVGEIKETLKNRKDRFVIVSMVAGVDIKTLGSLFGFELPVIRIMPNTAAAVGAAMIAYACSDNVGAEEVAEFKNILSEAGRTEELSEGLIDAASAVFGCGPAYVYMFMEAMADGGVYCGLPRDKALVFAAQALAGAAKLMLETGAHPGALKDAVCSPGGTTIAGVKALEDGGFRGAVMDAVIAAYNKTLSLRG